MEHFLKPPGLQMNVGSVARLESRVAFRTFQSIAMERIICADNLVLAPNFYYSLATVCNVLTNNFNFQKYGILFVIFICVLIAYLALDN